MFLKKVSNCLLTELNSNYPPVLLCLVYFYYIEIGSHNMNNHKRKKKCIIILINILTIVNKNIYIKDFRIKK